MYNGNHTHYGAAACSWDIPLNNTIRIGGYEYVCEDRGLLGNGYPTSHIDIWAPSYAYGQSLIDMFGEYADVEIVYP